MLEWWVYLKLWFLRMYTPSAPRPLRYQGPAHKSGNNRSFVCTILKHFVGGFRPHYIEACKPDWTSVARDLAQGIHHFNATVCQGNKRDVDRAYVLYSPNTLASTYSNTGNRLQAFPSGHAASSFAAAIFLALYLNAKLKVFSDYASDFWAFIVTLAPLILASLVSASMYTSHVGTPSSNYLYIPSQGIF
jgi:membrane-associated phospholipid phosphatase